MRIFDPSELHKLKKRSELPENGEVTIIGGSDLFHGAPVLSLTAASRVVDMVYFSSPEPIFSQIALQLKSRLSAFIWVPWEEVADYIKKSDAVLVGPGMKRFRKENDKLKISNYKLDEDGTLTKFVVEKLLRQFSQKQWVIDGGALQVMNADLIPPGAILTPNGKEFNLLFGGAGKSDSSNVSNAVTSETERAAQMAREHNCIIVQKGSVAHVCSPEECVEVHGGNTGLTKGGTGDTLAGLTVALAAQNEPFLAACAASWVIKKAGDELYKKAGTVYNADDLASKVPEVLGEYLR